MKTIEKLAVRGGPKHLFGMWKRVFKPKFRIQRTTAATGKPLEPYMVTGVTESKRRAAQKALKATARQAKRGVKAVGKALPAEAIPAAAIGAAGLGAGYALGRRRRKKKEQK